MKKAKRNNRGVQERLDNRRDQILPLTTLTRSL